MSEWSVLETFLRLLTLPQLYTHGAPLLGPLGTQGSFVVRLGEASPSHRFFRWRPQVGGVTALTKCSCAANFFAHPPLKPACGPFLSAEAPCPPRGLHRAPWLRNCATTFSNCLYATSFSFAPKKKKLAVLKKKRYVLPSPKVLTGGGPTRNTKNSKPKTPKMEASKYPKNEKENSSYYFWYF